MKTTALQAVKRLIPTKTRIWVSFDKPGFYEGEDVAGSINLESNEPIHVDEVRVEARVYEHYKEVDDVILRNKLRRTRDRMVTRFSGHFRVSGPTDCGHGYRNFPFAVSIPPYLPTHNAGSIEYNIEGVVAIKGRPAARAETNVSFLPRYSSAIIAPPFPRTAYDGPPSQVFQPTQVVTREVKMRCKWCNSLIDVSASRCPNCNGSP